MAPREQQQPEPPAIDDAEHQVKAIIGSLYAMMAQVSFFDTVPGGKTSKDVLGDAIASISSNLESLSISANPSSTTTPAPPSSTTTTIIPSSASSRKPLPSIPHDLILYVENARNPDIYTREFVELARRWNQIIKGKFDAFAVFRDELGDAILGANPELRGEVERVVGAPRGGGGVGEGQGGG